MTSTAIHQRVLQTCSCGYEFYDVPMGASRKEAFGIVSHWCRCPKCGNGTVIAEKNGRLLSEEETRVITGSKSSSLKAASAREAFANSRAILRAAPTANDNTPSYSAAATKDCLAEARKHAGMAPMKSDRVEVAERMESASKRLDALVAKLGGASDHEKLSLARDILRTISSEASKTAVTARSVDDTQTFFAELVLTLGEVSRLLSDEAK